MINIKHQLLFIKYLNSYTYLRYYVLHLDFVTSKFSKSLSLLPAKIKITELMETYGFGFFSWEWNYVVSVTLKAKQMVGFRKITAFFNQNVTNFGILIFLKKIGIHSMQGWAATARHGVTRKRSTRRLKNTENLFRKNLQVIGVC